MYHFVRPIKTWLRPIVFAGSFPMSVWYNANASFHPKTNDLDIFVKQAHTA